VYICASATCFTDRKVFFQTIHECCFPADAIIFAGNFNCYEYKFDELGDNFSPVKYLSDFRKSLNLIDAWRKLHPRSRGVGLYKSSLFHLKCYLLFGPVKGPLVFLIMTMLIFVLSLITLNFVAVVFGNSLLLFYRITIFKAVTPSFQSQ